MTNAQKQRIKVMRENGGSYASISDSLGLSINTVKSFCRRKGLGSAAPEGGGSCPVCAAALIHAEGARRRRFCSDRCRMAWWNAHPEAVSHSETLTVVCLHCGREFEVHGSRKRRYCSQKCYHAARASR